MMKSSGSCAFVVVVPYIQFFVFDYKFCCYCSTVGGVMCNICVCGIV